MNILPLTQIKKSQIAYINSIGPVPQNLNITQEEFEKRLLEMGFDEGTQVTILHEGPFQKDPLAVRIRNCHTVAIGRKVADQIGVRIAE